MKRGSEIVRDILKYVANDVPITEYAKVVRTGWEGDNHIEYYQHVNGVTASELTLFEVKGAKGDGLRFGREWYHCWEDTFGVEVKFDDSLSDACLLSRSAYPATKELEKIATDTVLDALEKKNNTRLTKNDVIPLLYKFDGKNMHPWEGISYYIVPKAPLREAIEANEREFLLTLHKNAEYTFRIDSSLAEIVGPKIAAWRNRGICIMEKPRDYGTRGCKDSWKNNIELLKTHTDISIKLLEGADKFSADIEALFYYISNLEKRASEDKAISAVKSK